jgi:hypothetical protein
MKYFKSLLLFSCFAVPVAGQNHLIGIKGGYSWTNISTDAFPNHETLRGFAAGLTYDYITRKKFSLGAELLYDQRGYKDELIFTDEHGNQIGEKYAVPVHYNYLSLPLKLGYIMGNNFFGFANIGFCPALLQKVTATIPLFTYSAPDLIYRGDSTIEIKGPSKFDLGGFVEIGCGYKIKNRFTFVAAFRSQYSFTSMTNEDFFRYYYIRHYGMTLSLGIKYNLSHRSLPESAATIK